MPGGLCKALPLNYRAVKTAYRYDVHVPFRIYLGASTASKSASRARNVRADSEHVAVQERAGKSRYWSSERPIACKFR